MLEELASEDGHNDYIADLRKIRSAGKLLLELINAILDLSKIEAGKMELHIETFSISNLLDDVVVLVEPLVVKNKNVVAVFCSPELENMSADATKVRQTLFNLLSNATKFTGNGNDPSGGSRGNCQRPERGRHRCDGHRNWHHARATRKTLPTLPTGGFFNHAEIRWHRAGSDDQQAILQDDGRRGGCPERRWHGDDVYRASAAGASAAGTVEPIVRKRSKIDAPNGE